MVDGEGGTGTVKATGGYTGSPSDPEILYISSTQQDGLFHYTGDIAELIIYGDTLTTEQRIILETYLAAQYGQAAIFISFN